MSAALSGATHAPVRIGVLGRARVVEAALLAHAAQTPEIRVVAIASRDLEHARVFATHYGIERFYGQYQELLSDPDVELVYNALPNSLHAIWSIAALRSGKAVLCEKPLAANASQAEAMLQATRETGRPLIEALHYRFHPLMRYIRALMAQDGLGPLRTLEIRMNIAGHHFQADDIRFDLALAGGAMMDLGPYCVDLLRLASGSEPEILDASATIHRPGIDGAMRGEMRLGHAVGRFECSLQHDATELWLKITGERGELWVDNPLSPQWGHALALTRAGTTEHLQFELTPSYIFQARHVAAVMREGAAIDSDAGNAVSNLMAIDAIYRAAGMSPRA